MDGVGDIWKEMHVDVEPQLHVWDWNDTYGLRTYEVFFVWLLLIHPYFPISADKYRLDKYIYTYIHVSTRIEVITTRIEVINITLYTC